MIGKCKADTYTSFAYATQRKYQNRRFMVAVLAGHVLAWMAPAYCTMLVPGFIAL